MIKRWVVFFVLLLGTACSIEKSGGKFQLPGPEGDLNAPIMEARSVALEDCQHGLSRQPLGPFSLFVACDGTVGTQIGLFYYAAMKGGRSGLAGWNRIDRYWAGEEWSQDVTTVIWGARRRRLFVGTMRRAHSGGIYHVDLYRRQAIQLYPEKGWENPLAAGVVLLTYDPNYEKIRAQIIDKDREPIGDVREVYALRRR